MDQPLRTVDQSLGQENAGSPLSPRPIRPPSPLTNEAQSGLPPLQTDEQDALHGPVHHHNQQRNQQEIPAGQGDSAVPEIHEGDSGGQRHSANHLPE